MFDLARQHQGMKMVEIFEEVQNIINEVATIKTISTIFPDERRPHSIQVGSLTAASPSRLIFGRVLTQRTHENLLVMRDQGELASVLINLEMRSYEIMARPLEYAESGALLDKMNKVLKPKGIQAFGVWTLEPVEIWNQSPGPWAGKRMV
jgi:hypothetical protein